MSTIEKIKEDEEKMREKTLYKILIEKVELQDALIYINKEIDFEDKIKDPKLDYLFVLISYFDESKKQINLMKQKK